MRILTNDTCPSCFQGELQDGICPVCGFQAAQETGHPRALPWFQILHNGTYLTGKVLGEGGFGITYIAKVEIQILFAALKNICQMIWSV